MTRRYSQLLVLVLLLVPAGAWAGKLTCLTGTDPSVANDLSEIAAVRLAIDTLCPCNSFNGSTGQTHLAYVSCVHKVIRAQSALRSQCKTTVAQDYQNSTCGVGTGAKPCIKKSAKNGAITCAIKPAAKCVSQSGFVQVSCPSYSTCIDAADTNFDGIIDSADSGACACTTGFQDNGDGTITDCTTRLMWEKKDRGGSVHDMSTYYPWAGFCSIGSDPKYCQPDASAAAACIGGVSSCSVCAPGEGVCNVPGSGATTWDWLAMAMNSPPGFAGHRDWRIPTLDELRTIVTPPCPGGGQPCVPAAFNNGCTPGCTVTTCSCTQAGFYWSSTPYQSDFAWDVDFSDASVFKSGKILSDDVRAVRLGYAPPATPATATPTSVPTSTPTPNHCGNGSCDAGENCSTCADCACAAGFVCSGIPASCQPVTGCCKLSTECFSDCCSTTTLANCDLTSHTFGPGQTCNVSTNKCQ